MVDQNQIDKMQATIDELREIKTELTRELEEQTQRFVTTWDEKEKLEVLFTNCPSRFTGKVRTKNTSNPEQIVVWNRGKIGLRDGSITLTDKSTIENRTHINQFAR